MDTAKVVLATIGTGIFDINKLLTFTEPYEYGVPSIFIPTTHGTGSEVTMWGTIWDTVGKKKYSISHPNLYPSAAILDGNLTLSLPMDISIITVMDALSHSFEAIWNKNANKTSTSYAIEAISLIIENIENFKMNPSNLVIRKNLLIAANLAGLAFSNTKTAAAHSISYPLTINYGIPHGIAASVSLIPLLKLNSSLIMNSLDGLLNKIMLPYDQLISKIKGIADGVVSLRLSDWGVAWNDLNSICAESFTKDRMENNIRKLNKEDILAILKDIY